MSIRLTPFTIDDLCTGHAWQVQDLDLLASRVAAVAVGQSRHVERIIAGVGLGPPVTQASTVAGAVSLLTVSGDSPYQRDGWLFQVLSWLAAHEETPGGIIRTPHMLLSHKGFDGLQLELDETGHTVSAAVIFEDKATSNPRATLRDEVWPELSELETGARDHLLAAEVVALLRTSPAVNPDTAIENVIWKAVRGYRVSVTVTAPHSTDDGRRRLFRGYDAAAQGHVRRRRTGVLHIQELRPWLQQLADMAIRSIPEMVPADV